MTSHPQYTPKVWYFVNALNSRNEWTPVAYSQRPDIQNGRVKRKESVGPLLRKIPDPWDLKKSPAYVVEVPNERRRVLTVAGQWLDVMQLEVERTIEYIVDKQLESAKEIEK